MGRYRYIRIVLSVFLLMLIGSVVSCTLFCMDCECEEEPEYIGNWIYSGGGETVTLSLTENTLLI